MIAVIVINYRDTERTVRFVREECPKIRSEHRVLVVDNASTAASASALREALPDATVLSCPENQGFARGNNQGAETAIEMGAAQLLFVNNDVVFSDPGVIDHLSERLAAQPDAGLIGPKVVGLDGRLQGPYPEQSFAERHLLPYWGRLFLSRDSLAKKCRRDYAETAVEGPCAWVSGCCCLADARSFQEAGGFDPATFLYGEELILSARLARIGKVVRYDPAMAVLHAHGAVTRQHYDAVRIRQMRFESESYYYRKYRGTPRWQIALARFTLFLKRVFGR